MKRLFSTRFGFFGLAAVVCWTMLLVIQPEHRFVALGIGCLYAILSLLFFFEERPRERRPPTKGPNPFEPPP